MTATISTARKDIKPQWKYVPTELVWESTRKFDKAGAPERFSALPKSTKHSVSRGCPECGSIHKRGQAACDNSEWEAGRICTTCFLELPLSGVCGNCE